MSNTLEELNQRLQRVNRRDEDASPKLEEVLNMLELHLHSSDRYSEVAQNLLEYFTDGRFPEELIAPCQELLERHMPNDYEPTRDAIESIINPGRIDRDHLDTLRDDLATTITAYFG